MSPGLASAVRGSGAAAAFVLMSVLVSSCTAEDAPRPSLSAKDLPIEFAADEGASAEMLALCRGENVIQRHGKKVDTQVFKSDEGLARSITFVVVEATDDELWDSLLSELNECSPDSRFSTNGDVTMTADTSVEPVDGPLIGDESQWYDTRTTMTDTVTGTSNGGSSGVLVRSGNWVYQVSGYDVLRKDVQDAAEAALP
jgi:hypothetical protein